MSSGLDVLREIHALYKQEAKVNMYELSYVHQMIELERKEDVIPPSYSERLVIIDGLIYDRK